MWLFREENLDDAYLESFDFLKETNLKTAQAWAMKEQFKASGHSEQQAGPRGSLNVGTSGSMRAIWLQ